MSRVDFVRYGLVNIARICWHCRLPLHGGGFHSWCPQWIAEND